MWWRKISLSSRLSLLFRQSKNTELSFFVSQIFTSALFYSSSLSFFTTSLHIFLFFSLFCALMVTIFLYKCTFFSCSSVHSSLHYIFFYSVQVCIFYVKMMINIVDLVRKTLLGHIIITHALFFLCQCLCAAFLDLFLRFSLHCFFFFSKTHKAPALLALFSPTSVFHCFHPRTLCQLNEFSTAL